MQLMKVKHYSTDYNHLVIGLDEEKSDHQIQPKPQVQVSFDNNKENMPRRCRMTKSHIEGKKVPFGQLFGGQIVTFATKKQACCDLCINHQRNIHAPKHNQKVHFTL